MHSPNEAIPEQFVRDADSLAIDRLIKWRHG